MCRWVLPVAVLVLVLVLGGCGDEDDGDDGSAAPGTTELTITLDADGPEGEPARSEALSCDANEDSACGRLDATDLAPLDPATPCTEIYGGPDEVTIAGAIGGEEVAGAFTRANGCEIEQFDRFTPLLRELFPGYRPGAALRP